MSKMKAALLYEFNGIEGIEIGDADIPSPHNDEVQIETHYAGVNPADWKIAEGYFRGRSSSQFPITLGWDIAGVVKSKGPLVNEFSIGDEVFAYGRQDVLHYGAYAQYLCLKASLVVKKPTSLSMAQASSVPLAALTAWQSLFDAAHLKKGETILIQAGAGGVGGFAIQFALQAGAIVITTASSSHHAYIKKLGAHEIIDYTKAPFLEQLKKHYPNGVDVVFDTVGGETLIQSYQAVKSHGRLVSITTQIDETLVKQRNIKGFYVFVAPDKAQLTKIGQLFDKKKLIPPPIQVFEFKDIKKALELVKKGRTEGKIVIKIK